MPFFFNFVEKVIRHCLLNNFCPPVHSEFRIQNSEFTLLFQSNSFLKQVNIRSQ